VGRYVGGCFEEVGWEGCGREKGRAVTHGRATITTDHDFRFINASIISCVDFFAAVALHFCYRHLIIWGIRRTAWNMHNRIVQVTSTNSL